MRTHRTNAWRWIYRLLIVALVATTLLASCRPFRRATPYRKITTEPELTVYMHDTGATERMSMEQYLEGVVAGEMAPDWPLEALKAQAILARTFTIEALQRKGGTKEQTGTDVSTDEKVFQAYNASRINDTVKQAVAETRGFIMTHSNNPIRAWYHADAGGKTATAKEGLGFTEAPTPYIVTAEAPSVNPEAAWQASFSVSEVADAIRKVKGGNVAAINSAKIATKGPSGRATELAFGSNRVSAAALRTALGPEQMRSTMLTEISVSGGRVVMKGKGFGHGVGLPQWSARYFAERGEVAAQILYRFFQGVKVEQWWK